MPGSEQEEDGDSRRQTYLEEEDPNREASDIPKSEPEVQPKQNGRRRTREAPRHDEESQGNDTEATSVPARSRERPARGQVRRPRTAQLPSEPRNKPTWNLDDHFGKRDQTMVRQKRPYRHQQLQQQQGQAMQQPKEGKQNNSALALRLDLNLEIEIQLKARIQGDLTLTLL